MNENLTAHEYLKQVSPLPTVMDEIAAYGKETQVPILSNEAGRVLQMLVGLQQPKDILEIGCGISYSTHWMLYAPSNCHITALDTNLIRIGLSEKYLERSGMSKRVDLIQQTGMAFLASTDQSFDFIFLDSTKKGYADLLDECYKGLRPGGLLVADNLFFGGLVFRKDPTSIVKNKVGVEKIKEFSNRMAQHEGFESYFLQLGDGLLAARKKS